ncbi:hypothetical protein LLG07_07700, partial [bacterium]|nr:hypothetical protein [bacterium]
MASIQYKVSRGYKYWYIVESRRVNGKPRPIVLLYLAIIMTNRHDWDTASIIEACHGQSMIENAFK